MNREQRPLYTAGIAAFQERNREKLKRIMRDPDLSLQERKLLQAREVIRKKGPEAGLEFLKGLSAPNDFFVAEKALLMAHAFFLVGDFESAVIQNTKGLEHFVGCNDRRGAFLSLYNLSVDYNQMGANRVSGHFLKEAEKRASGPAEKSLVARAWACQYSAEGRHDEACASLEKAFGMSQHLGVNDLAGLFTVAADIYFCAGRLTECIHALESSLKGPTVKSVRGRARFELQVVRAMASGKGLLARKGSIALSEEYALKWEVLRALQSGEIRRADKLWKKLEKASPQIFGPGFIILSPSERSSIFGTYLASLVTRDHEDWTTAPLMKGRLGKLHSLLSESPTPLRKEELIERIWLVPYDPTLDTRFYKLIERLKKVSKRVVLTANRTYSYGQKK